MEPACRTWFRFRGAKRHCRRESPARGPTCRGGFHPWGHAFQWYPTSSVAGRWRWWQQRHRAPGVGRRRDPRLRSSAHHFFAGASCRFGVSPPAAAEGEKKQRNLVRDTASSFGLLAVVGHCLAHARCGYASVCYRTSSSVKKKEKTDCARGQVSVG